ncbi:MAG: hypothetical protein K0V04_14310 [Deltaproteobacteria bacterium]|nr:hypothetical protein [Deltaproteobacteria bacterium]
MPADRVASVRAHCPRSVTRWGRRRFTVLAGLSLVAVGTGAAPSQDVPTYPTPASTRLTHDRVLPYPTEQVWPAALRYLRVDRGYTLVDRDRDGGFIVFDFPVGSSANGTRGSGSVEIVSTVDMAGRPAASVKVSTDAGPVHLPHAIAEGLAAKLKEERGQPAPPPQPEPPPSPAPDPAPDDGGPWAPEPPPSQFDPVTR